MSLLKKLAGETAIYGLSSIVGRLVNWVILTPYLTRIFLKAEYGIVSDLYFYIALLMVLFTYRMETAFFRFASRSRDKVEADTVFSTASLSIIATTVAFTVLLLLAAPQVAEWLLYPDRVDYVRLFTLIIAFDALAAIPFAKLRIESRPIRFALIKLGSILLNIVLLFFFLEGCPWLIDHGVESVRYIYRPDHRIAYIFWANLLASAATLLFLAPLYRQLAWRFATDVWRRMVGYALPLILAGLAGIVNLLIGPTFLKYLGAGATIDDNLALAGLFGAAAKLAVLMNLFVQAFNYAAEPFFFRQAAVSNDRAIYADVARAFALVGSLAFLGIMLYLDVIQLLIAEDYRAGLGILPILLVANYFLGLFYNFSIGFKLSDQTQWGSYLALLGAAITVVVNIALIPTLGYYAPAWASLLCFGVMGVGSYFVTQRLWPVPYPVGRMAYYLGLSLVAWGAAEVVDAQLGLPMVGQLVVHTILLGLVVGIFYRTEQGWLRRII